MKAETFISSIHSSCALESTPARDEGGYCRLRERPVLVLISSSRVVRVRSDTVLAQSYHALRIVSKQSPISSPSRECLTISRVHTRRIQTLSFPSTPSTLSNSTPSHQHLLAGLRQNSNSFCAMPTALAAPAESPRTSVRRRASAMEQITAFCGSAARCPQVSSWLNPLSCVSTSRKDMKMMMRSYPAVSISMRCCSVVPGSSLFLRPEKMPFCRSSALLAARLISIISCCWMSLLGGMA